MILPQDDVTEEPDSAAMQQIMRDIEDFQRIHQEYEDQLQIKSDQSDAIIQLVAQRQLNRSPSNKGWQQVVDQIPETVAQDWDQDEKESKKEGDQI